MKESTAHIKVRQDLLRYLRVVHMLIKVLQTPFSQPPEFPKVKGFNRGGISLDVIERYPRLKNLCMLTYDILAKVRSSFFSFCPCYSPPPTQKQNRPCSI